MRVLVAGGAGFIGSHLCRALLAQGHEVCCLDNLVTGQRENIAELIDTPRFEFIEADVTAPPLLSADLVLHLASPASPVHYKQYDIETMMANSVGTQKLLDIARAGNGRFLFVSTSEVYGDPLQHPQTEDYWGNVNPIGTRACYDESKRFGEALTFEYRRRYGLNASIVRIFNTYGPRMAVGDGRVIPAFIMAALAGEPLPVAGSGNQTRSFCYVSDLVEVFLEVAFDRSADGEVFNLGNPEEVTILELAQTLARLSGHDGAIRWDPGEDDGPQRRRPDITKVRKKYGWQPVVGLEEGLRHTIEYYQSISAQAFA